MIRLFLLYWACHKICQVILYKLTIGIFLTLDISPMMITYTEYQKPFSHFLTDTCAIVGGIFTMAGLIDGFIYTAEKRLGKKVDLGKAS